MLFMVAFSIVILELFVTSIKLPRLLQSLIVILFEIKIVLSPKAVIKPLIDPDTFFTIELSRN